MKGKVILLSSVVLLMLFAFAPLMASANACYVVPASFPLSSLVSTGVTWPTSPGYPAPPTPTVVSSPSYIVEILHLAVPLKFTLIIDSKTYLNSYSLNDWSEYGNLNTGILNVFAIAWWYPGPTPSPADGFKGVVTLTVHGWTGVDASGTLSIANVFIVGFGSFAGQTLVLHGTVPPDTAWAGYDIIL